MIFDGSSFAQKIISQLPRKQTRLMVVLDPANAAGRKYVELKKQVAERLGVLMVVVDKPEMEKWNNDPGVDGIMVQLPYPNSQELVDQIDPGKDVDGMREVSPFKTAVVRAVVEILKTQGLMSNMNMVVVGNKGFVGRRLVRELGCEGMDKDDFDLEKIRRADVVISCTGQAGLVKPEMVKEGVVAIDLGYPRGDFDPKVADKSSFFTPVPGGVGPVTVAMLFKNLLKT